MTIVAGVSLGCLPSLLACLALPWCFGFTHFHSAKVLVKKFEKNKIKIKRAPKKRKKIISWQSVGKIKQQRRLFCLRTSQSCMYTFFMILKALFTPLESVCIQLDHLPPIIHYKYHGQIISLRHSSTLDISLLKNCQLPVAQSQV